MHRLLVELKDDQRGRMPSVRAGNLWHDVSNVHISWGAVLTLEGQGDHLLGGVTELKPSGRTSHAE